MAQNGFIFIIKVNMFIIIALKEILESILSFKVIIVTLLCLVLIPLSIFMSLKDYKYRVDSYNEAEQFYNNRSKGHIGPGFIAEGYRPPSSLSIFSHGLGDNLPYRVLVSNTEPVKIETLRNNENLYGALWGRVDFVFIVTYFLSMVAIIFSYRTIVGEKDTLRLLMSNSVSRSEIILAKVTGNYLVVLIPFLFAMLISLIILNLSSFFTLYKAGNAVPLLLILFITMLFLFAVFNLGVLVSLFTRNANNALVALLFIWIIMSLIIPKLSPMLAQIIVPIKPETMVNNEINAARKDIEQELIKQESQLFEQVLRQAGADPQSAFNSWTPSVQAAKELFDEKVALVRDQYHDKTEKAVAKIQTEYDNRKSRQLAVTTWISRLSPVSSYVYALTELCGTGISEVSNFNEHAQTYYQQVKQEVYSLWVFKRYAINNGNQIESGYYNKKGVDPMANQSANLSVPHFTNYRLIPLKDRIINITTDVVLLCLYTILFFSIAYAKFLKYDLT